MDDQLQTNPDQTVPSTPIDITPQSTVEPEVPPQMPVTVEAPAVEPTQTPIVQAEQAVDVPPLPIANEPVNAAESPMLTTQEPSASPTPEPETVIEEQNAAESPLPEPKKKKISPVIMGVLALFLVAGIGGAAYYVSNQLSTRTAVAPNAPESKTMASCGTDCCERWGQKIACSSCATGWSLSDGCCVRACGEEETPVVTDSLTPTYPPAGPGHYCPGTCMPDGCNETQCGYGAGTSCETGDCCRPLSECTGTPTPPPPAAVDGVWGAYSACSSTTCGTPGTKTRTCNNPAPANGGSECTRADGTKTTASNRDETVSCTPTDCVVGACTNVKIYRKPGGVGTYETTALSENQLQQLKVGDELKFVMTANTSGLRGKFIVTVNGNVTTLDGTTSAGTITYTDYLVSAAGTYKFEGQVSVIP